MNPGCSSVPALSVPPGFDPSGKYVVIIDSYGNTRALASPDAPGFLMWDGFNVLWADGEDNPFTINLPKVPGPLFGLIAPDAVGRWLNLVNETSDELVLKSKLGQVYFAPITEGIGGSDGEGALLPGGPGIVIRQPGETDAAMWDMKGLIYINDSGAITQVENGVNGQFFAISGGIPKFISLPSGNIASGSGVATLEAISAGSLSSSSIQLTCPLMRLTDGATDIDVANILVTFDFANPNGNNGLDTGAEATSKWYYLYVISDGATVACVASQSPLGPDLTSFGAFQFKAFASVFRNDASGNIVTYVQRGRNFWTPQINMADNVPITTAFSAVPQTIPMSNIIPILAKTVRGIAGGSGSASSPPFLSIVVSADAGGTGLFFLGATEHASAVDGFKRDAGMFEIPILDGYAPTMYWKANANDNHRRISFTGFSI